ncbi:major tail protein [Lacticaseibacillus sp. GG6-2]
MVEPTSTTPSKAGDVLLELTVGDLFFAMKTTNETASSEPEYSTEIARISNIKKIAFKGNGKSTDIYASGKKFGTITQETNIEVTHTHIGMPVEVLDQMKGVAAEHGVEFGTTDAKQMPEFAIGFDTLLSNGQHDGIWLTSCTLYPAMNDSHETSEDAFKEVNPEIVYNAGGLRNSGVYYARYNSARDSADMSIDDFFKQVIYSKEQLEEVASPKP